MKELLKSRRAINLEESFMAIFDKKEDYENFKINKTGTGLFKSTDLLYYSCW